MTHELLRKITTCPGNQIEEVADQIVNVSERDRELFAKALFERTDNSWVQTDPDTEDAVCSALVRLGVMDRVGANLMFVLSNDASMPRLDRRAGRYRGGGPTEVAV